MKTTRTTLAAILALIALLALGLVGCAAVDTAGPVSDEWSNSSMSPWERLDAPRNPAPRGWDDSARRAESAHSAGIFDLAYRFYVSGLTQIDGPRCEHRPTCSRYGYQAVSKHGFVVGSFLTIDRLMRGPNSSIYRNLPIYRVHEGRIYYYDPVENNDFFL